MSVLRLVSGELLLHSPCKVDSRLEKELSARGTRFISHGDLIEKDAKEILRRAWAKPLASAARHA